MQEAFWRVGARVRAASFSVATAARRAASRAVLALCLGAIATAAFAEGIEGRIVDRAGRALVDAPVALVALGEATPVQTAQSNADGAFRFIGLRPGTYVVRVSMQGLGAAERRVTLSGAESVRLELMLSLAVAEDVTVVGTGNRGPITLDEASDSGSRLGLTARELPASLEVLPQSVIHQRAHRTVQEAVSSAVGVTAGQNASAAATYVMRGFTQSQVPILYEGTKIPVPMAFPADTWNLERLDILKGPSSSLFGEGAVGGAVNLVVRRPDSGPQRVDGLLSYGGFNTRRLGLGVGGPVSGGRLRYRVDYGYNQTDGYVDRTPGTFNSLTSAVDWVASPTFETRVTFDLQDIDVGSYWGTPLVPRASAVEPIDGMVETADGRTFDRVLLRVNYNTSDGGTDLRTYWTQVKSQYRPAAGIVVRNSFYHTLSDRAWRNAETYAFNPRNGRIDRDRFFVAHHVTLVGNRFDVAATRPLGRWANRLVAGVDVYALGFDRVPFYRGDVDSVDRFVPAPGVFGPLAPTSYAVQSVDTAAFFVEDYVSLRSDLKLTGSLRFDRIDVDHAEFVDERGVSPDRPSGGVRDESATFGRSFTPITWRAGLVYDTSRSLSVYGSVATASDPSNADFLFGAPADFDLARGIQVEVGTKHTLPRGLGDWTAACYWIERRNILTQTSPTTARNIGRQSSRGVELNLHLRPTSRWSIQASAALLEARFDEFQGAAGDSVVSWTGNRPPNVPNVVFDAHASYRVGDRRPLEVSAAYRHVGDRFNRFDNAVRLLSYDLVDAFATWHVDRYRIGVGVRNLFDEDYVLFGSQWFTGTMQMDIGAPRSAEVSLGIGF
jgi:iron complex outermembrane receptor protein